MRVNTITGVKTLLGFGPKISSAVVANPDGLLLQEGLRRVDRLVIATPDSRLREKARRLS
jgi:hypothetical protein